jgi:hypothetical protein
MTTDKSADEAVLDDVFSSSRDRGADPAASVEPVEKVETPAEPEPPKTGDPEKAAAETSDDGSKPKGYRDPETGRFVPLEALKSERELRQEAQKARDEEARLRKDAEDNARKTQERIAELERRIQAAQNPQPQQARAPDPNEDPVGYLHFNQQRLEHLQLTNHLNNSENLARQQFGDQVVDEALQAALKAGVNESFLNARHPYAECIKWYKRQQTLARVGDDPDAYEKSIEERVRAKVLEELKAGTTTVTGQAAAPQRFPGSLVDATASGAQGAQPISDEALLGSIFDPGRKRR